MKIFKKIGLIALAVLVGVASIFLPMTNRQSKTAHADTTSYQGVVFNSSNIIYSRFSYITRYIDGNTDIVDGLYNFPNFKEGHTDTYTQWYNWSFKISSDSLGLFTMSSFAYLSNIYAVTNLSQNVAQDVVIGSYDLRHYTRDTYFYQSTPCSVIKNGAWAGYSCLGCGFYVPDFEGLGVQFEYPSFNMTTIELGNYYDFPVRDKFPSQFAMSNVVCYTDTVGYRYYFFIPNYDGYSGGVSTMLEYRKYYTQNALDFTTDDIYQQGFNDGRNEGLTAGENLGYQNGYDVGYQQGEISGFNDGAESANRYTFLNLIGAVVDAPVSVFKSMFNFNLLGVNLRDFFLAVLTFCAVTLLVKLALMRK